MRPAEIRSCEDALKLLAAHLDGELEDRAGAQVERHLARCRSCYSRAEFEKRLKEKVAGTGRTEVHPKLKTRIQTLIEQFSVSQHDDTD